MTFRVDTPDRSNDAATCHTCRHPWHGLRCTKHTARPGQPAAQCPCPTAWKEPTP